MGGWGVVGGVEGWGAYHIIHCLDRGKKGGGEISVIGKFKIPRGDNPPNVYK